MDHWLILCQLDWATRCPDIWTNTLLAVSVRLITGPVGTLRTERVDTGNKCSHVPSFTGRLLWVGHVCSSMELCSPALRGQLVRSHRDRRFLLCFGEDLRAPSSSPSLESALTSGLLQGVACLRRKAPVTLCRECSSGPGHC